MHHTPLHDKQDSLTLVPGRPPAISMKPVTERPCIKTRERPKAGTATAIKPPGNSAVRFLAIRNDRPDPFRGMLDLAVADTRTRIAAIPNQARKQPKWPWVLARAPERFMERVPDASDPAPHDRRPQSPSPDLVAKRFRSDRKKKGTAPCSATR